MINKNYLRLVSAMIIAPTTLYADKLFILEGNDLSNGTPANQSIASDKLLDDILGDNTRFQLFETSTNVNYLLTYAGIKNFSSYDVGTSGTGVTSTFRSDIAGINKVFSGADRDDVDEQLEEFLKAGGWSKLAAASQIESLVAVTDGNPNSTTALIGNQTFSSGFDASRPRDKNTNDSFGIGFQAGIRSFKAGGFDGTSYRLPIDFKIPLGEKSYANLSLPLAYTEIGDAQIFHGGVQVSVPIEVYNTPDKSWVLSPSVGTAASFSEDFVSGSAMWNIGLTSSFRWSFDSFYVTVGNHVSHYEGIDLEIDDFNVGGDLSQQIVKNGLKISMPFSNDDWELEAYAIHSAFLADAAVSDYWTPGIQLSKRIGDDGSITVRLEGDYGDDFESVGIRFGGGFKF